MVFSWGSVRIYPLLRFGCGLSSPFHKLPFRLFCHGFVFVLGLDCVLTYPLHSVACFRPLEVQYLVFLSIFFVFIAHVLCPVFLSKWRHVLAFFQLVTYAQVNSSTFSYLPCFWCFVMCIHIFWPCFHLVCRFSFHLARRGSVFRRSWVELFHSGMSGIATLWWVSLVKFNPLQAGNVNFHILFRLFWGIFWVIFSIALHLVLTSCNFYFMKRVYCSACRSCKSTKDPHLLCPDCRPTCSAVVRCSECAALTPWEFKLYLRVVRKRLLQKQRRMSSTPPAVQEETSGPPPPVGDRKSVV